MKTYSDEELIKLCKEKNEDAFNELYKRYYPTAYKLAYHICKNDADARDVAQETMISVYQNIASLKQPQYFPLWLKRIVVGKCNRVFRKEKHVRYVDEQALQMKNQTDDKRSHNPNKQIRFHQDKEVIQFFVKLLPEAQGQVMGMFYFEQLSIKEIAKELNISEGTVKSRIFMAKKKLKQLILDYEKREEIALDFQSEALLATLATGYLGLHLPGKDSILSALTSTSMKAVCITVLGISCVGFGNEVYKQVNGQDSIENQLILEQNTSVGTEEKQFQKVILKDMEIENAQDAYFKLLLKADTLESIQSLSKSEYDEIKALYTSLENYGGSYLDLLKDKGWDDFLQEYVK